MGRFLVLFPHEQLSGHPLEPVPDNMLFASEVNGIALAGIDKATTVSGNPLSDADFGFGPLLAP